MRSGIAYYGLTKVSFAWISPMAVVEFVVCAWNDILIVAYANMTDTKVALS